jgi:hypothetical protein
MPLHEVVGNFHMHTPYSDGAAYHAEIAEAALRAGLDCVCVTDHNVWVNGPARYYVRDNRRVLLLVGEEVHDVTRKPQKSHLLVYGAETELARLAPDPQALLDAVAQAGGLAFLAHPVDPHAPLFHEADLSWVDWHVHGYTGLELWNYMTSFKSLLKSYAAAIRYAFNPELGIRGPFPETLRLWDELTAAGQRVVAIGNADAHGIEYRVGALRRTLFPYDFLFRQVNTHLLTETALTGDYARDRALVLDALARGHCFVGYDGAAPARGFRFTANFERGTALMGDEVFNRGGVTLQIVAPLSADLRLLRNSVEVAHWDRQTHAAHVVLAGEAGVFRVEAHLPFQGGRRGWIYSNPIYVRK